MKWVVSLLLVFVSGCRPHPDRGKPNSLLLFDRREIRAIKEKIAHRDSCVRSVAERLRTQADRSMHAGPWSVTFAPTRAASGSPHDFFSEGPYWWPDPKNPNGPYVRRDGEVNPDRFTAHDNALKEMAISVMTLGLASYVYDDAVYAQYAATVIRTWFADEKTRMNPHLEYGQAIKGVTSGRGIGIIDSTPFIWALQGMALLRETGFWSGTDQGAVEAWFRQYLQWLTTSRKGLDEKFNGNNHSTWWAAQAAAIAVYLNDSSTQDTLWTFYREYLVPHQIEPDGSCPLEEARTKSLSYSAMNLNGFAVFCRLAGSRGEDLWHFRSANGASMEKALQYLMPFVLEPHRWKKQQIAPFDNRRRIFLVLSGLDLEKPEYLRYYRNMQMSDDPVSILGDLMAACTIE